MDINEAIEELSARGGVRFDRALRIAGSFFGPARNRGGSHYTFKMPWEGKPWVTMQRDKGGRAKPYQIRQLIRALERLRSMREG